jgi:branched-chain amino acid transport system substrate-binding protein
MKMNIIAGLIVGILLVANGIITARAEVKVGIAGDLSGSALTAGEQQEIGALKAIGHLNEKGGLLGEEIVAISVDDACEQEQAKAVARQLVSEDVVFVVGHACSGASLAAGKIYEKAGVIMISPASTNPKVTDEGGSNVFRVIGRDDQQGTIAGNYLADNYSKKNIAIMHDSTTYSLGLAEFTKRQLNQRGVAEVMFESYIPGQKDYYLVANNLFKNKIDILYAGGMEDDIGIILRQTKKVLPGLLLISADGLVSPDFLRYAGEAGEGTYFTFGPDMRLRREARKVVDAIREEDAYEPGGYTLYSYGAVQAWAQAVQQAGSFKADVVIDTLRTGTFDTVIGRVGFDEKGDVTGISTFVWYIYGKETYSLAK